LRIEEAPGTRHGRIHSRNWLLKGHFDFDGQNSRNTTTMQIRDELRIARSLPPKNLVIANFPSGQTRKHTYWWRDTEREYGEGQFVAAISKFHPVLSLGVSIEKGVTAATASRREQIMDSNTWDWQRLVNGLADMLEHDVPSIAKATNEPIHVRIRSRDRTITEVRAWHTRVFSFVQDQWLSVTGVAFVRHHKTCCTSERSLNAALNTTLAPKPRPSWGDPGHAALRGYLATQSGGLQ
jgi:hypothetical protein